MVKESGCAWQRRRLGGVGLAVLGLWACAVEDRAPQVAMPVRQVLPDHFVLSLPLREGVSGSAERDSLHKRLTQLGILVEQEFSERVGLSGIPAADAAAQGWRHCHKLQGRAFQATRSIDNQRARSRLTASRNGRRSCSSIDQTATR